MCGQCQPKNHSWPRKRKRRKARKRNRRNPRRPRPRSRSRKWMMPRRSTRKSRSRRRTRQKKSQRKNQSEGRKRRSEPMTAMLVSRIPDFISFLWVFIRPFELFSIGACSSLLFSDEDTKLLLRLADAEEETDQETDLVVIKSKKFLKEKSKKPAMQKEERPMCSCVLQ